MGSNGRAVWRRAWRCRCRTSSRAIDAASPLMQGRTGRVDVGYVARLPNIAMLSPGAIAEVASDVDEIEQRLRVAAAEQMEGWMAAWRSARIRGSRTVSRGALRCSPERTSCSAGFAVQPCRELGAGAWAGSGGLAA